MKHIISLAIFILSLNLYAGEGNSGGGPRRDMGGNSARVARSLRAILVDSHNRQQLKLRESSIREIAVKGGSLLDKYDLQYNNAGKMIGATRKNGNIILPTNRGSMWEYVELENGTVIRQKKNYLRRKIEYKVGHRLSELGLVLDE